jgi:hypothetical protein
MVGHLSYHFLYSCYPVRVIETIGHLTPLFLYSGCVGQVIVMVGLPARGKTYIAKKLTREYSLSELWYQYLFL